MADERGPRGPQRPGRPNRKSAPKNSHPRRKPDAQRDDERSGKPARQQGDRPARRDDRRDGKREGQRDLKRDGERREYKPRERDNHRDRAGRGGTRGAGRSDRGGVGREFTEAERLQHELRPVRAAHTDPELPEEVTAKDLNPGARNELKTLDKDLANLVARHLAMASILLEADPELAHQHAISAARRAGRIPVTRETLAITSYVTGDYAGALRELRTYRRLSGSDNQLAMMIDCERALGRPEKALELGRSVPLKSLPTDVRVQVAISMSGARLDLGQTEQALLELEIPQLDPNTAFSWSPELFAAYASVLEDLNREAEAKEWRTRAEVAEAALNEAFGAEDVIEVIELADEHPETGSLSAPGSEQVPTSEPQPEPESQPGSRPEPEQDGS